MSLFDTLVDEAIRNRPEVASLRPVVEKEILHHDILRTMNAAGLLANLTFMGGTCLRACYGSNRLSEDLDFTGGADFNRGNLRELSTHLIADVKRKYGLEVHVKEPVRETGNVDTWKLKVITRPGRRNLPAQRINIDICSIPSYQRRPVLLKNRYDVDMGTSELIVHVESREEILADKVVALALRPNRVKFRDLWDIGWLKQHAVELPTELIERKIADHKRDVAAFVELLLARAELVRNSAAMHTGFIDEMKRFLPPEIVRDSLARPEFWTWLSALVGEECDRVVSLLRSGGTPPFRM